MKQDQSRQPEEESSRQKVTLYSEWCKRCGNCVAFCPREAFEKDEWGYPYLARPERCTSCKLCEMLCPDFALGVSDAETNPSNQERSRSNHIKIVSMNQSPERLAPEQSKKE